MISINTYGWKNERGTAPLSDIHETIAVPKGSVWRKMLAFMGPGYLVAVGYMDPGNWATSLAGGSQFGYTLLAIALMSNIMAILLQALCVRLAIATGRDLAQACRDAFSRPVSFILWLAAEIAICATDLAEIIGTAVGLQLLFGIPIEIGVLLTALDVFLILALQRLGFRYLEAFVLALLAIIAACFGFQIFLADPVWSAVLAGFIPTPEIVTNPGMLYLALGILGATVMPHNLYLHSAIVQSRRIEPTIPAQREAIKYATIDSTLALMLALLINASILILAAAAFHGTEYADKTELADIHRLLAPVLGSAWAPMAFGVALLCCGLNSTITATLAGQAVMEGFLHIRLSPALRRLITRGLAIIPAVLVAIWYGSAGVTQLLILSQVVLSLQLSFAVVPLVMFTANRVKMGAHPTPRWMVAAAILVAILIVGLNLKMLADLLIL